MQVPLQIAFHNMDSVPWAEEEIRARVADLEKLFGRLVACRVRVDRRASDETGAIPPVVRIELGIPGHKDIVVAHEPDRLLMNYQKPNLSNAINEAFRVAERRLLDWKEQADGKTKINHHDAENQFLGQVAEIHPVENYGFILTKEGGLLYFHRNSLLDGNLDDLKRGDELRYVEDMGDTGPIATKVRVKKNGD